MKHKTITRILLSTIFLSLITSETVMAGFLGGIAKSANKAAAMYLQGLWIISSLKILQNFFDSVYKNLIVLILANPRLENFAPGMEFFMRIVIPFYVLGILATSLYMLFLSGSPEGRAKAKSNLIKLLYSMILVALSPLLLNLLFFFSSTTASMIMNMVDKDIALKTLEGGTDLFYEIAIKLTGLYPDGEGSSFFSAVLTASYYLWYILPLGRLVFITFFSMLLPFSIFLYSFYSTKNLGKTLIQQLIMIVFIQVAWAIAIAVISVSTILLSQYTEIPHNHIEWGSYAVFTVSPLIILGIMDWFGFIVFVIDATTTGPLCVGPVVMDELYAGRVILPEEATEDVADM